MHKNSVVHNDVKPENVLLHQEGTEVVVKLGDLGLAEASDSFKADFWMYGMTGVCLVTGEKFGTRKYADERIVELIADIEQYIQSCGLEGKLGISVAEIPSLLHHVFNQQLSMELVRDWRGLQNWTLLEEERGTSTWSPHPCTSMCKCECQRASAHAHARVCVEV